MDILLTSTRKIVRDVGSALNPTKELEDLAAAEAAVNDRDVVRAEVTQQYQDQLEGQSFMVEAIACLFPGIHTDMIGLTRQLSAQRQKSRRPHAHPTPEEHDKQLNTLYEQAQTSQKQVEAEQTAVARKEADLKKWRAEKELVDLIEVGDKDGVTNSEV
jgi:kinetochore protein Spc24